MQAAQSISATDRFFGFANWLGAAERSRGWHGYLNAGIALLITVALRIGLEFMFEGRAPTYMIFLAPVLAAALLGGVVPGLVTTVVALGLSNYFFVNPATEFNTGSQDLVVAGVFVAEGAAISILAGRLRATVERLVDRERQLAASEDRLVMAQEAARIATYEWDPATGTATWSDNAEDIMAMAPGTFAGTFEDSLRTVVEEDRPLIDLAAQALMQEGANEADYRVTDPGGEVRWIHATGLLVRREGPDRDSVVGVMMDVTERRRAAEHNKFLADATAQLASSMDYAGNVAGLVDVSVPRFATFSAVILVSDGQFPGRVASLKHSDPDREPLLKDIQALLEEDPERPGAISRAVRSGTPLYIPHFSRAAMDDAAVSAEHLKALNKLALSSVICIPLVARGVHLGGLVFAHEGGRTFSQADYDVAVELGRRASVAIENGLLLEQSFDREAEVSRKNEALQLIADAGVELSSTLDLSDSLAALATLLVPRFSDVCTISLMEDAKLEQVAVATATPALANALSELNKAGRPDPELFATASQVLRGNRPIFLPEIPEELYERLAPTEAAESALAGISVKSMIIMPLSARGQTLGVMTFLRTGESPAFDRQDLSLAGQIARRTAVSADNGRLYAEARRANDAKDEFLGMMSHELRTPITVIHGGARVLQARSANLDEETRAGLLGDIERESERLSRMLENLLALARAELDREVIIEPVLLQRLLPRLVGSLRSATGREVTLESIGELPAVSAEPAYIEHIVRNLVGNAVKYSPPNTPIDVCMQPEGEGATIRVRDRGFGIAPEESSRIFERFYRSDRTSRLAGGAGLGLAVCKRLVEAMSGEIWAAPREGGGLEVGFSLPPYREEYVEV